MAASCSHLSAARGSRMNIMEKMFDIAVNKVFTGAAPLMGACAMADHFVREVSCAGAAAATAARWPCVSHPQ